MDLQSSTFEEENYDCIVCFESLKTDNLENPSPVVTLPCHHLHCFHSNCLKVLASHSLRHNCPICRVDYPPELVGDNPYDNVQDTDENNNTVVIQESYMDDLFDEGFLIRNTDTEVVPDSQPIY